MDVQQLHFDPAPPHMSPTPASVVSLTIGRSRVSDKERVDPNWTVFCTRAEDWQDKQDWHLPNSHPSSQLDGQGRERPLSWCFDGDDFRVMGNGPPVDLQPSYKAAVNDLINPIPWFAPPVRQLICPLPPGLLPDGLRLLQLPAGFNQPLQLGSLSSTLTYLQLIFGFDQQLPAGVLLASLLYLSLPALYDQPMTLPASLERLRMNYWPHPLEQLRRSCLQDSCPCAGLGSGGGGMRTNWPMFDDDLVVLPPGAECTVF